MSQVIDFYFDFTSPYGYLASELIEPLASRYGRTVAWRPYLLGAAFKVNGGRPPTEVPLKGEYVARDFPRSARFHGIPYRHPSVFPVPAVAATRAYYWVAGQNAARAVALARAIYHAYFIDDVNIAEAENVVKVAAAAGHDANAVRAALAEQAVKDRTKAEVDAAIARGAFGSPYVIVDGEPFWGVDRFDQLERWLQKPF